VVGGGGGVPKKKEEGETIRVGAETGRRQKKQVLKKWSGLGRVRKAGVEDALGGERRLLLGLKSMRERV